MKKGICFATVPDDLPLDKRMKMIAKAGFAGIEVKTIEKAAERKLVRKAADAAGLVIHSVMDAGNWTYPLSSSTESVRKKGLAITRASIDTAVACGADTVLVVPGVVNPETPVEVVYKNSLKSLKELAPYAAKAKVTLAVENVWNKFLLSPPEFCDFIDAVKSKWVQAYFDVGNIAQYGFPEQWIRSIGPRLRKVHIKGYDAKTRRFCYLLESSFDWKAVRQALREVGYDGWITAEMNLYPQYADQMLADTSAQMDRIIAGK
jgi:hexulose-6-phosphate isomerase